MNMRLQIFLRFSVAVVLQAWILLLTTSSDAVQLKSLEGHRSLEEELAVLFFSFLPTAALTKNQSTLVSKKCVEDSRLVMKALLNHTEWALSMFQASGKLPVDESTFFLIAGANGVLDEPGHFDQCITSKPTSGDFEGKYCSVFLSIIPTSQSFLAQKGPESYKLSGDEKIFKPSTVDRLNKKRNIFAHDNPTDLIIGFCLPSSCSASDIHVAITHGVSHYSWNFEQEMLRETSTLYSIATVTHERYCHTETKNQEQSSFFDWITISFLIMVCIIFGLVLTSTIHEIWKQVFPAPIGKHSSCLVKESTSMKVLQCFSAVRNIKDWLTVKNVSADEINCLHGLRVISLFVTILIHTSEVVFVLSRPTSQEKLVQYMSKWIWFPLTNGSVVMENCLVIGGILTCTSLLKDLNRGRFNLFRFYFYRFLRLTPLYLMVLFFVAALAARLGSGPNWNIIQYQSEDCRNYWWSHLLYINNIFPSDLTFCMPDTWYSAVDMQLFLISPFFILPLWHWPRRIGPTIVLLGLSASLIYPIILNLKWNIPLIIMLTRV